MAEHIIYLLGPYRIPGFQGERNVRVYLPSEGGNAGPSPVLFLFDGQNVFHDDPSYSGGWHLHQAVRDLSGRGLAAPVLVGIDHGGSERLTELSPFPGDGSDGRLDDFLGWITSEIVPAVRERFAVRRDPAGTAIGGSSMGGLAALYAHFRRPDVLGAALCMSPSLWFAERKIFDFIASQAVPASSRLYIDAGAQEDDGSVLRDAAHLVEHLRHRATAMPSCSSARTRTGPTARTRGAGARRGRCSSCSQMPPGSSKGALAGGPRGRSRPPERRRAAGKCLGSVRGTPDRSDRSAVCPSRGMTWPCACGTCCRG
ncbi:alpha/beta hydrolase [Sorangium sp. So ce124]|uniref:alpha/beta hydrolase n=1 Tax=Sorangium sp. So ce124 TaxID=3133280 RepID=UPI003F607A56